MSEKQPIKSFEDLGKVVAEEKAEKVQKTREIFDRSLKGKFEDVVGGHFGSASKNPNIESIAIAPVFPEKGNPVIYARLNYLTKEGQSKVSRWSIFENGDISGRVPPDLDMTPGDVRLEIMRTIEPIHFRLWEKTKLPIVPASDETERMLTPKEKAELKEEESEDKYARPERLKFLEDQQQFLFGFVNNKSGFDGYAIAVFPNCLVAEKPEWGNAAYVLDLKTPIAIDDDTFKRPADERVGKKDRYMIIDQTWGPIAEKAKTRLQLKYELGAERIIHDEETWRDKLQKALDARLSPVK